MTPDTRRPPAARETAPPLPPEELTHMDESDLGEEMSGLDRAIAAASRAVAWLVFIAMAISVYEVVMRYGFDSPTSWVHETTVFMIAVIFALGGPTALARNKHIRVRILYDHVSPKGRRVLDIINGVLGVLFGVGLTYAAWVMTWTATHSPLGEWQFERSGTSWNPAFPAYTKAVILLAAALMTVQLLLHLVAAIRRRPAAPAAPVAPSEKER